MKRNCQRFVLMPILGCLGLMIALAGLSSILPTKETPTPTNDLGARGDTSQLSAPEDTATPSVLPLPSAAPSPTPRPTQTSTAPPKAAVTPISPTIRYITTAKANVRECPGVACATTGQLAYGDSILADGQGNDTDGAMWYRFERDGAVTWVASWLTSASEPVIAVPVAPSGQSSSNQPAAPADRSSPGFACNCSKTCDQMSCAEAYFQLQTCGCGARDGDGDGVPCESICPGG